jgi:hypothetical protein
MFLMSPTGVAAWHAALSVAMMTAVLTCSLYAARQV